ncbi:MAG: hypothetical protein Q8N84_01995, partial [bacterium]|nr:hypothetical protein [bacterium]
MFRRYLLFLSLLGLFFGFSTPLAAQIEVSKLKSSTHPDSEQWYERNIAQFSWAPAVGARALAVAVSKEKIAVFPENKGEFKGEYLDRRATEYKTKKLEDGIWFFHLFIQGEKVWGAPAAVYQFKIDVSPPVNLVVKIGEKVVADDAAPVIDYSAEDALSGLAYFEVSVDGGQPTKTDKTSFTLPALRSGIHVASVLAYDKLGNRSQTQLKFTIKDPGVPTLDKEAFFKQSLVEGSPLVFVGQGKTGSQLSLKIDGQGFSGEISEDGAWKIEVKAPLAIGNHRAVAQVKEGPNFSPVSEPLDFEITGSFWHRPGVMPAVILGGFLLVILVVVYILAKKGWFKKHFGKKAKPPE